MVYKEIYFRRVRLKKFKQLRIDIYNYKTTKNYLIHQKCNLISVLNCTHKTFFFKNLTFLLLTNAKLSI